MTDLIDSVKSNELYNYCKDMICEQCELFEYNCDGDFKNMSSEMRDEMYSKLLDLSSQKEENSPDNVNHPSHYEQGAFECIAEMEYVFGNEAVRAFCICNVWKYRKRALFKGGKEDLDKADWYMQKFVELGGTDDTD